MSNLGGSVFHNNSNNNNELFQENIKAICEYFILSSKLSYKTYASTFMYNYLNSAYYGYLHKIAEDMGNNNYFICYYLSKIIFIIIIDMAEDYIDWV